MPSPHCRQPCVLRSNPAWVVSFIAPSSTESPTTSGGRPWLRLCCVWRTWVPPQPAWAAGVASARTATNMAPRTGERRLMPPETLPFRPAATMVFPSIEFAVFFPPVLALSWLLMPRPALHKPFILFCSYVFYAAANPKFCLLLGGVTLGNQAAATLIDRSDAP